MGNKILRIKRTILEELRSLNNNKKIKKKPNGYPAMRIAISVASNNIAGFTLEIFWKAIGELTTNSKILFQGGLYNTLENFDKKYTDSYFTDNITPEQLREMLLTTYIDLPNLNEE